MAHFRHGRTFVLNVFPGLRTNARGEVRWTPPGQQRDALAGVGLNGCRTVNFTEYPAG